MVVHGHEGLDEISLTGPTSVAEVDQGHVINYTLNPEELGFKLCPLEGLKGGDPDQCAAIATAVLNGATGPACDIVLLNSGAALYVSEKTASIAEGIELARESIASGRANEKLQGLIRATNA